MKGFAELACDVIDCKNWTTFSLGAAFEMYKRGIKFVPCADCIRWFDKYVVPSQIADQRKLPFGEE